jgi:DNA-binding winged helix-turn-helix (wHTH) protein/tetratricopeptide (TPR) repeat protein
MSDETGQRGDAKDIRASLSAARATANRDTPELYEFGPFRLDPHERKLLRGNEIVALTPKAFDTLLILVRNSGHLLEKDELIATLWPNTFVEEGSLSNNIFLLRKALGEDPTFIETVPRRGYRFVGAVRQLPHVEKPLEGHRELANEVSIPLQSQAVTPSLPVPTPVLPAPATIPAAKRRVLVISGLISLFLAVTVFAVASYFYFHGKPKLTDKDIIVLTDFVNTTGDPVFDDTLKQGLRVQLEQSPFLNILSDMKITEGLRMMGRAPDQRLTPEIARDLCQRVGSKAVLIGSLSRLGAHYVIGLNASNCHSGDSLASAQSEADTREHVLSALTASATKIREKLGESLASIQKYDAPLEQATTPSLEALKAYGLAIKTRRTRGDAESLPFFQRALELDADFALARANLADAYENLGESDLAAEHASKAYELRDRATERERFEISIVYYFQQSGELRKGIQTADLWAQSYPHDSLPYQYRSVANEFLGQYEKALTYGLEALRLDPDGPNLHSNLMEDYLALNRIDEAKRVYGEALQRKLDTAFLHDDMYVLAFLEGDKAEMDHQIAWALGKSGAEDMLLSAQSDTEAFFGRLRRARQLSRMAVEFADANSQKETAALWQLDTALQDAELGNSVRARQETKSGLARASTRDVQILAALTLARAGDAARSQTLSEELERRLPYNAELNSYWLPCIRAAIQINRGNPVQAIELLEVAKPYDLAFPRPQVGGGGLLYPVWLRGLALLLLNRGSEAAAEFQKILDHRSTIANSPISALAHLQLGRAYVMQGDKLKARIAYQDFFTLWKDADSGIPVLRKAKAEYEKLT